MKGYKLINPDGSVFGIFSDEERATTAAGQHLITRGNVLKLDLVEMPEFAFSYLNLIDAKGEVHEYEACSLEELEAKALLDLDGNLEGCKVLEFGEDAEGNELELISEAL